MERETLKSLRAKAKELRSKVSSAPLSRATPDQLKAEILMLERAVKAEEKVAMRKALKEAQVEKPAEKKKTSAPLVGSVKAVQKVVPAQKMKADDREKELLKRERELARREKLLQSQRVVDTESDSDD